KRPVQPVVTDGARQTVCHFIYRRLQVIRIRADKASPGIGRSEIVQPSRYKCKALTGVPIVIERETQMLCRVQIEIHRTEFADGCPIVINRQTVEAAGIWLMAIAIPVTAVSPVIE